MSSLRIGDAERESAVDQLGEQYAEGRISKQEFDERSDAAWAAKTQGDLAPLFADLPVGRHDTHVAGRALGQRGAVPARAGWRAGRLPLPLLLVLCVLVAVTVISHLPVILLALAVWFFWIRPRWSRHPSSGWSVRRSCS